MKRPTNRSYSVRQLIKKMEKKQMDGSKNQVEQLELERLPSAKN